MIINNNVGRYWRRYYTKPQSLSFLEPLLYLTTWLVVTGAVIILNSDFSRYRKVQVGKKPGWEKNQTNNQVLIP